jgi:hypothetical protein
MKWSGKQMSEEFKKTNKPLTEKLKVGDVFRFVLSNPRTMKDQNSLDLSGSALVSDYHADDDSYNIIIWDYKGKPWQAVGKAPILDIKEAGTVGVMGDTGVSHYKAFQLTGAHNDENFKNFKDEIREDLKGVEGEPVVVLFIILEMATTNTLKILQDNGSPLELDEKTGGLKVTKKEES